MSLQLVLNNQFRISHSAFRIKTIIFMEKIKTYLTSFREYAFSQQTSESKSRGG